MISNSRKVFVYVNFVLEKFIAVKVKRLTRRVQVEYIEKNVEKKMYVQIFN